MMKYQVTLTVDVDTDGTPMPPIDKVCDAVSEAVASALAHAQGNGHQHALQDEISILMDSEVLVKPLD